MSKYESMTDQELHERYIAAKVALHECWHTEQLINAYISITTEICLRYFDERGLENRENRKKIIDDILSHS